MELNKISSFLLDQEDSFKKFNRKIVLLLAYICKSDKDRNEFQKNSNFFMSMSLENIIGRIFDKDNYNPPKINVKLVDFIKDQILKLRWTKESKSIQQFGNYIHILYLQKRLSFNYLIHNELRTLKEFKEFINTICYYKIEKLDEKNERELEFPLIYNDKRDDIVWDGTHRILGYYFNYLYNNKNKIEPKLTFFYGKE